MIKFHLRGLLIMMPFKLPGMQKQIINRLESTCTVDWSLFTFTRVYYRSIYFSNVLFLIENSTLLLIAYQERFTAYQERFSKKSENCSLSFYSKPWMRRVYTVPAAGNTDSLIPTT
jgi:hypothetical protein